MQGTAAAPTGHPSPLPTLPLQPRGTPTCEVPTVLLFNLLSRLKLLFGMPLSHLVLQVDGVSLLPVRHPEKQAECLTFPGPPLSFIQSNRASNNRAPGAPLVKHSKPAGPKGSSGHGGEGGHPGACMRKADTPAGPEVQEPEAWKHRKAKRREALMSGQPNQHGNWSSGKAKAHSRPKPAPSRLAPAQVT